MPSEQEEGKFLTISCQSLINKGLAMAMPLLTVDLILFQIMPYMNVLRTFH